MKTSILLSGFDKNGFFDTVAKELRTEISDTKMLLFIASTPNDFTKIDEYTTRIFRFFNDIGIRFEDYRILDERMPNSEQVNAITSASCIFLMGGRAREQIEYLSKQGLIELLLNHQGVVIGLSAGAINMAKKSIIANPNYPPVSIYDGMGMVDVTVIPHFESIKEDYINNELFPLSNDNKIYGICDNAIIVIHNGFVKHGGTIYELTQGKIRLLCDNDKI